MQTRTMVVLAALVAGMSITSLLLVMLEPNSAVPPSGGVLTKQDTGQAGAGKAYQLLFETSASIQPWTRVLIQDSGTAKGSAESLEAVTNGPANQRIGYHFVINNGSEQDNGTIEIGYRWKNQFDALGQLATQAGGQQTPFTGVIAVCLIGDADRNELTAAQEDSLVWLVHTLEQQLGHRLEVQVDLGDTPVSQYRSKMLGNKLDLG